MQNPTHFYTNYESANDLVMLLCCTDLRNYLHHGNFQGCSFHLVPSNMGNIWIETETDSFLLWGISLSQFSLRIFSAMGIIFFTCDLICIDWVGLGNGKLQSVSSVKNLANGFKAISAIFLKV